MPTESEKQAADELDLLNRECGRATAAVAAARVILRDAEADEKRAVALYKRKALWIRADQLRKELARTENEAANIKLEQAPGFGATRRALVG